MINTPKEVIADRLTKRNGHYAKFDLVESQFLILEMPKPEEESNAAIVDNIGSTDEVVDRIVGVLERV